MATETSFDWSELAFSSKKTVKELDAIFIAAPRQMSSIRLTQIIKKYLPLGNLLLGIASEEYVSGLENRPQFQMLKEADVSTLVRKLADSKSKNKLYTLRYSQRDLKYVLEKIKPRRVLLINGSWYHGFHHLPAYYTLVNLGIPFEKISPFASEREARLIADRTVLAELPRSGNFSALEMMDLANQAAAHSYDFSGLQTGAALGRKTGKGYDLLTLAHNNVVPYETYSMHHGSVREKHFSPMQDLNYYDTVHAETAVLIQAQKKKLDLKNSTLFINLLPCPTCTRMLMQTDIAEIVYSQDHSDGYAIKMLELAGKKVSRMVL